MPDVYAILIGGLIGGPLMLLVIEIRYHMVPRAKDKEKDKQLRNRLKEIESEFFDFENKP